MIKPIPLTRAQRLLTSDYFGQIIGAINQTAGEFHHRFQDFIWVLRDRLDKINLIPEHREAFFNESRQDVRQLYAALYERCKLGGFNLLDLQKVKAEQEQRLLEDPQNVQYAFWEVNEEGETGEHLPTDAEPKTELTASEMPTV